MFTAKRTLKIFGDKFAKIKFIHSDTKNLMGQFNRWNAAKMSHFIIMIGNLRTNFAGNFWDEKMASALHQLNLALATMWTKTFGIWRERKIKLKRAFLNSMKFKTTPSKMEWLSSECQTAMAILALCISIIITQIAIQARFSPTEASSETSNRLVIKMFSLPFTSL